MWVLITVQAIALPAHCSILPVILHTVVNRMASSSQIWSLSKYSLFLLVIGTYMQFIMHRVVDMATIGASIDMLNNGSGGRLKRFESFALEAELRRKERWIEQQVQSQTLQQNKLGATAQGSERDTGEIGDSHDRSLTNFDENEADPPNLSSKVASCLVVVYHEGCMDASVRVMLELDESMRLSIWYLDSLLHHTAQAAKNIDDVNGDDCRRHDNILSTGNATVIIERERPDVIVHLLPEKTTVRSMADESSIMLHLMEAASSSTIVDDENNNNKKKHQHLMLSPGSLTLKSSRYLLLHSLQKVLVDHIVALIHYDPSSTGIMVSTLPQEIRQTLSNFPSHFYFSGESPLVTKAIEQPELLTDGTKKKICFLTSVFGSDPKKVDEIPNVNLAPISISQNSSHFQFYAFTNLPHLQTPGNWNKVVLTNLTYANHVISSRLSKFMAWTMPDLKRTCQTIFHADGGWLPAQEAVVWQEFSDGLQYSDAGLLQYKHMRSDGIADELRTIELLSKDTKEHVATEVAWLEAQPDYKEKHDLVCNMAFAYNPHHAVYQQLTTSFWGRYSQGLSTYRDQPAWNYWVHHYNITPLYLGRWVDDLQTFVKRKGKKKPMMRGCCWLKYGKSGYNNHKYVAS